MKVKSVLYLHGFNSHPGTFKAQVTRQACAQVPQPPVFCAPTLSSLPAKALHQAQTALMALPAPTLVIGSSLGGFLALCLAERFALGAIALLNPALDPEPLMAARMGESFDNPITGERVTITSSALEAMRGIRPSGIRSPQGVTAWLGSEDDVIDHAQTRRLLVGCTCIECVGDDHRLSSYPEHVADVLALGGLILPAALAVRH